MLLSTILTYDCDSRNVSKQENKSLKATESLQKNDENTLASHDVGSKCLLKRIRYKDNLSLSKKKSIITGYILRRETLKHIVTMEKINE